MPLLAQFYLIYIAKLTHKLLVAALFYNFVSNINGTELNKDRFFHFLLIIIGFRDTNIFNSTVFPKILADAIFIHLQLRRKTLNAPI